MGQALDTETCAIWPVSYSDDGDKQRMPRRFCQLHEMPSFCTRHSCNETHDRTFVEQPIARSCDISCNLSLNLTTLAFNRATLAYRRKTHRLILTSVSHNGRYLAQCIVRALFPLRQFLRPRINFLSRTII